MALRFGFLCGVMVASTVVLSLSSSERPVVETGRLRRQISAYHDEKTMSGSEKLDLVVSFQSLRRMQDASDVDEPSSAEEGQDASGDGDDSSSEGTPIVYSVIPAVMVGVTSSIIICALFLYATDLRDRCRHERFFQEVRRRRQDLIRKNDSSAANTTSAHSSDDHSHERDIVVCPMLPPLPPELDDDGLVPSLAYDHFSISHVSSMTMSLEGGERMCFADLQERMAQHDPILETSTTVTELTESHRVTQDTNISSLIKTPDRSSVSNRMGPTGADVDNQSGSGEGSTCSSLTHGSSGSSTGSPTAASPQLHGEKCLPEDETTPEKQCPLVPLSFELSPDTSGDRLPAMLFEDPEDSDEEETHGEERYSPRIQQIFQGVSDDDEETASDHEEGSTDVEIGKVYVREICFSPHTLGGNAVLGIDLFDATTDVTHPMLSRVDPAGPLANHVFEGDFVLFIDGVDTAGFSASRVLDKLEARNELSSEGGNSTQIVKLTVMSSNKDFWESDGQDSIDLGRMESSIEL